MLIDLQCEVCEKTFQREKKEVNRNAKIGRKTYCSLSCSGEAQAGNFGDKAYKKTDGLKADNRQDDYSMFRPFMARIRLRQRDKGRECNLTLQDLKEQWELQKGICPYTGWSLVALRNTKEKSCLSSGTASLDRIDSSKGYIKGNIEFVSLMAQYAKNGFSKEDVFTFCKAVAKLQK